MDVFVENTSTRFPKKPLKKGNERFALVKTHERNSPN